MYGIGKVRKSLQLAVAVAICKVVLWKVLFVFSCFFKCFWGWGGRSRQLCFNLGTLGGFTFLRCRCSATTRSLYYIKTVIIHSVDYTINGW